MNSEVSVGVHLMFNGDCGEALALYERAFGVKAENVMRYGDMPPNPDFDVPEERKRLILHAVLVIGGVAFMCADSSERAESGGNMYAAYTLSDEAAIRAVWDALAEGGEVGMPLQPTFFASAHGHLTDKFGVNWMLTAHK